jgi:hypothetical protein
MEGNANADSKNDVVQPNKPILSRKCRFRLLLARIEKSSHNSSKELPVKESYSVGSTISWGRLHADRKVGSPSLHP